MPLIRGVPSLSDKTTAGLHCQPQVSTDKKLRAEVAKADFMGFLSPPAKFRCIHSYEFVFSSSTCTDTCIMHVLFSELSTFCEMPGSVFL